jgi:hypothetical protein
MSMPDRRPVSAAEALRRRGSALPQQAGAAILRGSHGMRFESMARFPGRWPFPKLENRDP